MLSSLRRLPSSFRRFATKSSGAAYFASPNKVSLAVPTKIAEIAADSNYVALTKDMVWNNPQVPTRRSEDQDDFFFPNIHEPGKYEAVQVFGHKDKTNVVAWVHLGRQLCGAKGILHGGCIATVFDELFVTSTKKKTSCLFTSGGQDGRLRRLHGDNDSQFPPSIRWRQIRTLLCRFGQGAKSF
ncbi:hypothetical protein Ae201684_005612 [Aphanomyces euteiches]|uniref:Thioesterase domain-containing protein n=1 Tax=Aphanomyces euteiches TaxID=100861 RepID=A0A6G0XER1_9STRA|nr:hypothetical protein Ae201684_005612 [Aphanomyces euteiches]